MAARFSWKGALATQLGQKIALEAMWDGGEAIITEAMNNVPLLSGTLRRSATVSGTLPAASEVFDGAKGGAEQVGVFKDKDKGKTAPDGRATVFVSYNTPYAQRQHEDLNLKHPIAGQAKFLENAFNALQEQIVTMVKARVRAGLKEAP